MRGSGNRLPIGIRRSFQSPPVSAQFLANHDPNLVLQRFLVRFDMLTQGIVDQGLVIATTGRMDLLPEPSEYVVIDPDRDSCFPRRCLDRGTSFASPEIIFSFHQQSL